jgi:hypothetical protein
LYIFFIGDIEAWFGTHLVMIICSQIYGPIIAFGVVTLRIGTKNALRLEL